MAKYKKTIVAAWVTDELQHRPGLSPRFRPVAKAAMWKRHGTAADTAKARAYCAKEGCQVFLFDGTERDPLGKAKARATHKRR